MKKKLIVTAIILAVLFFFGFRITHPNDGLQSAMGSAKSSLAVYQKVDSYKVGEKVAFQVTIGESTRTYTGVIITEVDGTLGVDANNWMGEIKAEDTLGKLFVVVPFFGTILGIVGL